MLGSTSAVSLSCNGFTRPSTLSAIARESRGIGRVPVPTQRPLLRFYAELGKCKRRMNILADSALERNIARELELEIFAPLLGRCHAKDDILLHEFVSHAVVVYRVEHVGNHGIAEIEIVLVLRNDDHTVIALIVSDETEILDVYGLADKVVHIALVAVLHERNTLVVELVEIAHFSALSIVLTALLTV